MPVIVGGADCKICDGFISVQKEMLSKPKYQIHKENNAWVLVLARDVTVLSSVDALKQIQQM